LKLDGQHDLVLVVEERRSFLDLGCVQSERFDNALVAAGYFGTCDDPGVKLNAVSGAKGEKVQSLKIEGVHLCCGKYVKAVDRAVKSVSGAKEHTAVKGAKSFEVTGDFNDRELFTALQKEGLTGRVAR
jgi:hypothetical protein